MNRQVAVASATAMEPDQAQKIDLSISYIAPFSELDKPQDPRTAQVEAIEHKQKFMEKMSFLVQKKHSIEHKQKKASAAANFNKSEGKKRPRIAEIFINHASSSKDIEEGMQSWRVQSCTILLDHEILILSISRWGVVFDIWQSSFRILIIRIRWRI